ncbi:hypothetical protein K437DRAFT_256288 [Tilletiaria anomala UBC 951]|uniref:Uncharacterized protein n=1 Tax=Tilletiaria anomala (strain ATCC 24038 / CBS 436.72 / UBC 951) TaxID=1037660 RepID=A0A066W5N9_TILAU|nr:uncharacterized protein K437DRAFT_256288 [Tilletiaria anomala UBC 951]KDN46110.1 hypothetical protein K437DRAFT_256288 [Tilletiaria anomala UBC 951]
MQRRFGASVGGAEGGAHNHSESAQQMQKRPRDSIVIRMRTYRPRHPIATRRL